MAQQQPARGDLGRDVLVDVLLNYLATPRSAVALVGLPGAGLTAVAMAVVARFRGVKVVIGGPDAPGDLVNTVGGPLAARLPRLGLTLLVVDHDGRESPANLRADLESWRSTAPDVRVLLATGEPLGLDGERVVEVPPLSEAEALAVLSRAVALPADALDDLRRVLRGHALALHLASRRLTVLEPAELVTRCQADPFGALRDPEAAASRHRSLAARFAGWWGALGDADRRMLSSLSVFGGPFSREAMGEVLAGDPDETLDQLQRLALRRWVRRDENGRWELDPWIAAWASRHEPETRRLAGDRMRAWLAGLLAQLGPEPHRNPKFQHFFSVVGAERDHLLAAINGVDDPALIPEAAHLARVGVELELVVPRPGAASRIAPVVAFLDHHVERVNRRDRIRAHVIYGSILARGARFDEALRSLAAVESEGSEPGESVVGTVRNYMGDNLLLHGRYEEAATQYTLGLDDALAVDDAECATTSSMQLAIIRVKQRRMDEAKAYAEQALAFSPTRDSEHRQARVWQNAAFIFTKLLMLDRAEDLLRRALAVHERVGTHRSGALTRLQIADQALRRRGDREEALRWMEGLPDAFRQFNDARLEHAARGQIARAAVLDSPAAAVPALLEAAGRLQELGFPEFILTFRALAAYGLALMGDTEGAVALCDAVLAEDARHEDTAEDAQALAAWIREAARASEVPDGHLRVPALRAAAEALTEWAADANLRAQVEALLSRVSEVKRALWVGPRGDVLVGVDGERVHLSGVNARLLARLASAWPRGTWCDVGHLAAAGWPDEELEHSVAAGRVRVALSALRKAGLREALERGPQGWRITPDQPVRRLRTDAG